MLSYQDRVPDKTIERKVTQRLGRAGLGSQSRITVVVRNGQVTMSGTLQYDTQRAKGHEDRKAFNPHR